MYLQEQYMPRGNFSMEKVFIKIIYFYMLHGLWEDIKRYLEKLYIIDLSINQHYKKTLESRWKIRREARYPDEHVHRQTKILWEYGIIFRRIPSRQYSLVILIENLSKKFRRIPDEIDPSEIHRDLPIENSWGKISLKSVENFET